MDYISYSQYNSYTRCPRSWYLSYIRKAEQLQTWYLPIGTAVHQKIEAHLKGEPERSMSSYFYPLIESQMEIEPDLSAWLAGGPKADPEVGEKALQKATDCYQRALQELDDIEVWEVEYDASGSLPGLEVPVKGFIDIIGKHKKKGPVILDWKTGSTKPDNFQLQTYAALLRSESSKTYDGFDFKGRYVMLAPGSSQSRYVDLSDVDPAMIGARYQSVLENMRKKIYEAKAGFNCKFCFNKDNCLANSGMTERAMYYDRSAEDGFVY